MPSIKVMLVNNYQIIRAGLRMLLQAQPGIEVVAEANFGTEAIALAQKQPLDVILTGANMPSLSLACKNRR